MVTFSYVPITDLCSDGSFWHIAIRADFVCVCCFLFVIVCFVLLSFFVCVFFFFFWVYNTVLDHGRLIVKKLRIKLLLSPGIFHMSLWEKWWHYLREQDMAKLRLLFLADSVAEWKVLLLLSFLIKQLQWWAKGHDSDYSKGVYVCLLTVNCYT